MEANKFLLVNKCKIGNISRAVTSQRLKGRIDGGELLNSSGYGEPGTTQVLFSNAWSVLKCTPGKPPHQNGKTYRDCYDKAFDFSHQNE